MRFPSILFLLSVVAFGQTQPATITGTVLDPETARMCMLAGAEFFVTPSLKLATIELAKRYAKVVFPGAMTPTEVLTAWEAGADAVKIFPCGNVGGPKYIKALKGPFPQIEMIPTGGVNLETAGEFLKAGACAVAVGGELVDPKLFLGHPHHHARVGLGNAADRLRQLPFHQAAHLEHAAAHSFEVLVVAAGDMMTQPLGAHPPMVYGC